MTKNQFKLQVTDEQTGRTKVYSFKTSEARDEKVAFLRRQSTVLSWPRTYHTWEA